MTAYDLSGEFGCLLDFQARVAVESDFDFFGVFAGLHDRLRTMKRPLP